MQKIILLVGIAFAVVGVITALMRRGEKGKEFLATQFGDEWEARLIGVWLGWRLVVLGAVLIAFYAQRMTPGLLLSGGSSLGTASIVAGIMFIAMRHKPGGVQWFEKKFGANWQTSIFAKFLDWPLLVAGIAMWFPDDVWKDIPKLVGIFVAFWVYTMFGPKKAKKSTESDVPPPPHEGKSAAS